MKRLFAGVIAMILCLSVQPAEAKRKHYEKWYQMRWCAEHRGKTEVSLPDRTRCDCETETHAIEFDFGSKWAEAIGQALYYSLQLRKPAGVVLILESEEDYKYWVRLNTTVEYFSLPVTVWEIKNLDP